MDYAEAFVLDQITIAQRAMIPSVLKIAYDAAKLACDAEPIFNVQSALDNRGRIIQWSVDHALETLIKTGKWPFDYSWKSFDKPTGRYLEIRPSHSCLTVSQVSNHKKQPRDVRFRANKRIQSQGWLRGMESDDEKTVGLPHILLLHGHKQLNFSFLAMPKGNHASGFSYKSSNLMLMPHSVSQTETQVENTDYEAVMSLKDEIDRWRKDNVG